MIEHRTFEQIRYQYEIEKEIANRLRNAQKQERRRLYSTLYDELFQRVPHHPQLARKKSPRETARVVESQMKFLKSILTEDTVFIEIGPGDCALSYEVANYVRRVYAIDVSSEITKDHKIPGNFQLIISDGCSIPVPSNSVDVVYSNQLMEHLHPDDAFEQLENIYNALAPGGVYICITPNRLTGPHDVSKYFDEIATGLHLREYTISELSMLFRKVGFSKIEVYSGAMGIHLMFPSILLRSCEYLLSMLPFTLRKPIASSPPFRVLLSNRFVLKK